MSGDKFRMMRPCTNCPFRTDAVAIRFANRERAEEIEESAYRYGFPCHETAVHVEDDEDGSDGYHMGDQSQHCVGYTIMQIKGGGGPWPGIGNDDELLDRLEGRVDLTSPVFDSDEEYFAANAGGYA